MLVHIFLAHIIFNLAFSILDSNLAHAQIHSPQTDETCTLLLADVDVHIYSPTNTVFTPESRPIVADINHTLEKILRVIERGKGPAPQIYKAIRPQIQNLLRRGTALLAKPSMSQNEVYDFVYVFTHLIEFPNNYGNEIARLADGFASTQTFRVKDFNDFVDGYMDRHGPFDPFGQKLADYAKWSTQKKNVIDQEGLDKTYSISNIESDVAQRKYFFQYKYVFARGVRSLRELFMHRERGVFILGVSLKTFAPHDGQDGTAGTFLNHDRFHAFLAKYYDSLLFEKLGVTSAAEARRVKTLTNILFQERLVEWLLLPDPKLRDAIEVTLYHLLHENGKSYPLQVKSALSVLTDRRLYKSEIIQNLEFENLDDRINLSLGSEKDFYLTKALEVILNWVKEDSAKFKKLMRNNDKR